MSGGGDKGAYQAAVYLGLVKNSSPEEVAYDVLTGVSAGALNALALSVFEPTDLLRAADFITALWNSVPDYSVYQHWPGGIPDGLFLRKGIFDISPGRQWLTDNLRNKTVKRKVSFATVDANAAEYYVIDYNATETQPEDLVESALASSALPGIFSQVNRGNRTLIDGGVIWNLDISSAIRRCKEIVENEEDIIVDIILCGNENKIKTKEDLHKLSAMDHMLRSMEIKDYYSSINNYRSTMKLHPNVQFRHLIVPSEDISDNLIPLEFSKEQIDRSLELGQKDALSALKSLSSKSTVASPESSSSVSERMSP